MQNEINTKVLVLAEEALSKITDGIMKIKNLDERTKIRVIINNFYEKKNEIYKKDCIAQIERMMLSPKGKQIINLNNKRRQTGGQEIPISASNKLRTWQEGVQ